MLQEIEFTISGNADLNANVVIKQNNFKLLKKSISANSNNKLMFELANTINDIVLEIQNANTEGCITVSNLKLDQIFSIPGLNFTKLYDKNHTLLETYQDTIYTPQGYLKYQFKLPFFTNII